MKYTKFIYAFLFLAFIPGISFSQTANYLNLQGTFWDDTTGIDLPSKIYVYSEGKELFIAKTDKKNKFNFLISDKVDSLVFKSDGFADVSMPLHFFGNFGKPSTAGLTLKTSRSPRKPKEENKIIYCHPSDFNPDNEYNLYGWKNDQYVFIQDLPKEILKTKSIGLGDGYLHFRSKRKIVIKNKLNESLTEIPFEFTKGINFVDLNTYVKEKPQTIETEASKSPMANNKVKEDSQIVEVVSLNAKMLASKPFETQTIFFDQSKYDLGTLLKIQLDSISEELKLSDIKISVKGYTDNVGDERLNAKLAEYRAKVVANYLTNNGIDAKRIKVSWEDPNVKENNVSANADLKTYRKTVVSEIK